MIGKAIQWLASVALGSKLVKGVNAVNKGLTGARTEINLGVLSLLFVLKHFGIVGAEADTLVVALLGALPITLAEKFKSATDAAEAIIPKPEQPA